MKTEVKKPIHFADKAIYHPDADHLFSDLKDYLRWYSKPDKGHHKYDRTKPTLGILFYKCTYLKGDLKAVDALLKEIEKRGCNVVATYGATGGFFGIKEFFMQENKSIVDVVISLVLYSMSQEEIKAFHTLDVPIILGKTLYYDGNMSPDEWKKDPRGMPPNSVSSVSLSETLGIIEPTVIAVAPADPDTGKKRYEPINSQIEFIVNRALGYARLRHKANSDKKIVIMYYNDGCGKANLGTEMEFYLDAQASIVNLLRAMKDAGYNLGDKPIPSADELSKIMAEQGSNVGVWAQGELKKRVKDGSVILIPEKKYLEWFNELPEDKRREAIDKWGEPPGKVMVYEEKGKKYIAIPRIQFGNVLLTPYPTRGWLQDKSVLSHEGAIPPYHQFIA